MKYKRTINTEAVVGNVKPSFLDRFKKRQKVQKNTGEFVFNSPKISKNKFFNKKYLFLVVFLISIVGIISAVTLYLDRKTPIEKTPIPGQPVGPPPTATKLEDPGPRDSIQILPKGDGPTPPNGPSKPATGG